MEPLPLGPLSGQPLDGSLGQDSELRAGSSTHPSPWASSGFIAERLWPASVCIGVAWPFLLSSHH